MTATPILIIMRDMAKDGRKQSAVKNEAGGSDVIQLGGEVGVEGALSQGMAFGMYSDDERVASAGMC